MDMDSFSSLDDAQYQSSTMLRGKVDNNNGCLGTVDLLEVDGNTI